jgi:hypothetical protein
MVQVLVFLKSSRTTVKSLAKACHYCSFCFHSWETLLMVQGYVFEQTPSALLLLTFPDPAPFC